MNSSQVTKNSVKLLSPTRVFVGLIILTVVSAFIGEFSESNQETITLVLILMVIKAQLIIDHFMHLREVKITWRLSMSAFSVAIAGVAWLVL